MLRSIRSIALALIAAVSFLIAGPAMAQFNQHYSETTLNFPTGQGTIYLPIPRQGWPVQVAISGMYTESGGVFTVTSFVVSDGATQTRISVPVGTYGDEIPSCTSTANPDRSIECYVLGSYVTVGITDPTSVQAHKMFVSVSPGTALQLRITMWY